MVLLTETLYYTVSLLNIYFWKVGGGAVILLPRSIVSLKFCQPLGVWIYFHRYVKIWLSLSSLNSQFWPTSGWHYQQRLWACLICQLTCLTTTADHCILISHVVKVKLFVYFFVILYLYFPRIKKDLSARHPHPLQNFMSPELIKFCATCYILLWMFMSKCPAVFL